MRQGATLPRRPFGILLLAALGVGAAGAILFFGAGGPRKASASNRELAALRAELDDVKRRADRPQVVREIRTVQSTAVAPPAPPQVTEEEELTPEEEDHRRKVLNETRSARFEETFQHEPRDSAWSDGAARSIQEAHTAQPREGLELSAECRSTLCRVAFRYASPKHATAAGSPIPMVRPWPGRAFSSFNLSNNEGVMYLAREGFDLPSVDPESLAY